MPITIHNRAKGLYQFDLILNGEKVHTLIHAESIVLPVPEGDSQLIIKNSRHKAITVSSGDVITLTDWAPFQLGQSAKGILIFIALASLSGLAVFFLLTGLKVALKNYPDLYDLAKFLIPIGLVLLSLLIPRVKILKNTL